MDTVEDLQLLKAEWEDLTLSNTLTNYLKLIRGDSVGTSTRSILGMHMTDELANGINWSGVNNELSLASTPLTNFIIGKPVSN
ncbi:hypothetical protein EG68_03147 [Paragonimus skrjabini miyazakii]|uniref:Uncharacterized protein n=1 Tax=Paragonimus skrjabini miyazakii TaxID=59628 RepID=A0A8S9YW92_9TREM|nr:hypothetical protein EG68_03147 [Paragonimus skrjabini miyazakii]